MTKTRPAPLGATYKRNVRPSWFSSRPDVAPSGADRVLFNPSYKDFAPPELGRCIAKRADSGSMGNDPLKRVEQGRLAVPSIRTDLCELCVLGRRSLTCIPHHWRKRGEVCSAVKFYGTIPI
jgi:hypothetical protein